MSLKHLFPAIFWGAVIFFVISMPPGHIPDSTILRLPFIDKAIHFTLFFIFTILLAFGLYKQKKITSKLSYMSLTIITLTVGVAYSATTELIQSVALSQRHGSFFDFLANAIGTVFGLWFFSYLIKPYMVRKK